MSDVFLSYAREDRPLAARLAAALEAQGWSVWWDRQIVPGQHFDREIERALAEAGAVVVLWSPAATASDWVRNEAGAAQDRGVLVPAIVHPVALPLEFRRNQTAQLEGWQGQAGHEGFESLCRGLRRLLGGEPATAPIPRAMPRAVEPSLATPGATPSGPHPAGSPDALPTLPPVSPRASAHAPVRGRSAGWLATTGLVALIAVVVGWRACQGPGPAADPVVASAPAAALGADTLPSAAAPRLVAAADPATAPPPTGSATDLANRVAGRYRGDIISDSQGGSRMGVQLTVSRIDALHVRIDSADEARLRLPRLRISLAGHSVLADSADTALVVDLSTRPPRLSYSPRHVLSFSGVRQDD